jgi:glycosyltransferase involved in cell wall biosynthesis
MKLSIIVPVYNMAADGKLNYCLDSLLNQQMEDFEIIPVDDASTDHSAEILRDYAARFPERVRPIYSPENRRQGGAKNLGLEAATGTWVGFIDSDDWASPDMFSRMIAKAEETGADVVGCQYSFVSEHTMIPGEKVMVHDPAYTGEMTENLHRHFVLLPGSMVVKIYLHSVIEEHHLRFPEHTFYEDNQAGPIWMLHFTHFELVDKPFYFYYQHEASTVHTVNMDRLHDRMRMGASMIDEAKRLGFYDTYRNELEANFIRTYYTNTLFSYMQSGVHAQYGFLKELQQGMKRYFPAFEENAEYQKTHDAEQKKLMHLHMQCIPAFVVYDRLLRGYRKIRY